MSGARPPGGGARAARPVAALALALAAACGSAASPTRTPAELRAAHPEALLDPGSYLVLELDLARLRRSPHAASLESLFEDLWQTDDARPGLESVLGVTERLVLGVSADAEGEPVGTLVLVGTVPPGQMAAALERELGPGVFAVRGDPSPWRAEGPRWTLLHDGQALAAVTSRALAPALLRRWTTPGPTPLDTSPALTDAAALAGWRGGALGVVLDPSRLPRELTRELEDEPTWARWGGSVLALGARVDLSDGLAAQAVARLSDPQEAAALVGEIQDALASAQRNLLLDLLLGVRPILAATYASARDDVARVATRLPAGDTERLVASLRSVVGYADRAVEALRREGRRGAPPRTGRPLPGPTGRGDEVDAAADVAIEAEAEPGTP